MVPEQFFREKALLYEEGVRTAICIANSDKREVLMYITKLVRIIQLSLCFQDSSLGRRHYYTNKMLEQQYA